MDRCCNVIGMKADPTITTVTQPLNRQFTANAVSRNSVRLVYRITANQSARLAHFAQTRNTTRSIVIRAMLDRLPPTPGEAVAEPVVTAVAVVTRKPRTRFQPKTKKLSLRLSPDEYERLSERATAYGMSRVGFINHAWRAAALKRPEFLDAELIKLRAATRELTAVGSNLNQIARRLNEQPGPADGLGRMLAELKIATARQRDVLSDLLQAAEERWA